MTLLHIIAFVGVSYDTKCVSATHLNFNTKKGMHYNFETKEYQRTVIKIASG